MKFNFTNLIIIKYHNQISKNLLNVLKEVFTKKKNSLTLTSEK